MGPNKQKKPQEQSSKLQQRRRNFVHAHRGGPRKGGAPSDRDPVSSLSKESRAVVVDVLKHVAGVAEIPDNFDPSQSSAAANTIVLKRNAAMTSHQILQLIFERFGYPPDVVQEYVDEVLLKPGTPQLHSINAYLASEEAMRWCSECSWDLFAMMVWNSAEGAEMAARQTEAEEERERVGENDNGDDDEADELLAQEIETVQMIFEEQLLGVRDPAAFANAEDRDAYEAELVFALHTKDDVLVHLHVRLPTTYPQDTPLVRIDLPTREQDGNQRRAPPGMRLTLSPQMRRAILDTAVASIATMIGSPALIPLVGACKDLISSFVACVPATADGSGGKTEAEVAREREAALKARREAERERSRFVDALAATVIPNAPTTPSSSPLSALTNSGGTGKSVVGSPSGPPAARTGTGDSDELASPLIALPKRVDLQTVDGVDTEADAARRTNFLKRNASVDAELQQHWRELERSGPLSAVRRALPAHDVREELRRVLETNQVVVIGGETGSGKTTQVPQFLLEYGIEAGNGSVTNIVCTQPRRLAATAVALRVAEERNEAIGGTVGYSIRLENKFSAAKTRLLYCTTGIVLRRLQTDHFLGNVSHVVVDEIHERGVDTDFLLILLKDLMVKRKDVKIILMSATMNSELFSKYFYDAPVVAIKGRTHPVEVFHLENIIRMVGFAMEEGGQYARSVVRKRNTRKNLTQMDFGMADASEEATQEELQRDIARGGDDMAAVASTLALMDPEQINYELIEKLVDWIDQTYKFPGAILVFMPGMAEIQRCCDELKSNPRLASRCVIHNLHSSLGSTTQQAVFAKPPHGKRKVIIGTNIMETSITIDDAVFVIDSGKFKENRYDARKSLSQLVSCTIAKANASQRAGRAGRVRPGYCFRLYTSAQFDKMEAHQVCEMHRVPLESLVLQIYMLRLGDEFAFLQKALSPPQERAVRASVNVLQSLGALTAEKRLTSLGFHLANLPLDVRVGKMIIHGALLRCLDPVVTIAACLSVKPPFVASTEDQVAIGATRRGFSRETKSDQLAAWFAYLTWVSTAYKLRTRQPSGGGGNAVAVALRKFCADSWLSQTALAQIQSTKQQYERYLVEAGFVEDADALRRARGSSSSGRFLFEPVVTLDDLVYECGGPANNVNSGNHKCIVACLLAGLYPNVVRISRPNPRNPKSIKLQSLDGSDVLIHPSSVAGGPDAEFGHPLLLYVDKIKTSQLFVREVSQVSPLQMVLFGGPPTYLRNYGEIVVDSRIGLRCAEEDAVLLLTLRQQLDSVLRAKINDPSMSWETASLNVVKAIIRLMREEGTGSHAMVVVDARSRQPLTAPLRHAAAPAGNDLQQQQQQRKGASEGSSTSSAAAGAGAAAKGAAPYAAVKCHTCGDFGHRAQHCPNPPPKERGAPKVRCFICGAWHWPLHCTLARSVKDGS